MITEESFIDFKCPGCGEMVSFPQESAGSLQACPDCTQSLIVPGRGTDATGVIPLPITTSRLALRRLAPGDWKDLLELMADEEFFRYQEGVPLDEDGVLRWLESDAHVKLTTPDQPFHLAIQLQDGGKLIGYITLNFTDPQRQQIVFSLGLHRVFQRKGYALEAAEALLSFCFEGLHLHRVACWCDTRNGAACRLAESLGLRREGEFVKNRLVHGEWVNSAWYAALAEEYFAAGGNSPQPA